MSEFLILRGGQCLVREATERGYAVAGPGDSINIAFPESKTRRGRVGHGIAQTLLTGSEQVVIEGTNMAIDRCIQVGELGNHAFETTRRVYSTKGLSPTICARYEDYSNVAKVLVEENGGKKEMEDGCIQTGILNGGHWDNEYEINRRVYSSEGISPTLITTGASKGAKIEESVENDDKGSIRIRRLTPLECYRLMGFDEEDFRKAAKVCSESQLYKQAGNSIVVDVLEAIFRNLKPYFSED